jgi:hypothetical protein
LNIADLAFAAGQVSPQITQFSIGGTGSTAGQPFGISAQSGQTGSTVGGNGGALTLAAGTGGNGSTTNGSGADVIISTGGSGSGSGAAGSIGYLSVKSGGSSSGGWLIGSNPLSALISSIYANSSGSPSPTNFVLETDGTATTVLNAPGSGSTLVFAANNAQLLLTLGLAGFSFPAPATVNITGGGARTLTSTQYNQGRIILTGTVTGGGTSVVFPNIAGVWFVDLSQLTNFPNGTAINFVESGRGGGVSFSGGTGDFAKSNVVTIMTGGISTPAGIGISYFG